MKSLRSVLLLAGFFLGSLATNSTKTNASKPAQGSLGDGKIVVHQLCNSGPSNVEISSLKKELKMLRKELNRPFDKNGTKVLSMRVTLLRKKVEKLGNDLIKRLNQIQQKVLSLRVTLLRKKIEKLGNDLKKRLDQIQQNDPWMKLNRAPVCFGAKGDQFGKFSVTSGGKLIAIKLVHLYGYVSCDTRKVAHWSYWGCSAHWSVGNQVNVVITTSANHILLPSSQFFKTRSKWSTIPGYNSLSPELLLSVLSSPLTVSSGQELRLWYAEDLTASTESDNGGKSCCDVFARII